MWCEWGLVCKTSNAFVSDGLGAQVVNSLSAV